MKFNDKTLFAMVGTTGAGSGVGVATDGGGEIFNDYENNVASAQFAHAEGNATQATERFAHAEGYETVASALVAHAEGENTEASGEAAHAEGLKTKAQGFCAHAEGEKTEAQERGAHAEGYGAIAAARYSHAEGYNTKVYANGAHGEGYANTITESGKYAHIEGEQGTAGGRAAHAEGGGCQALANYSHAQGLYTIATGENQFVGGRYNKADPNMAVIIGNGTDTADDKRSNAYTLDWQGNGTFAGAVNAANIPVEDSTKKGCYYRMVNGKKEWINPPMVSGVEYRTAERFNGSVVYTKLVSIGSVPTEGEVKQKAFFENSIGEGFLAIPFRVAGYFGGVDPKIYKEYHYALPYKTSFAEVAVYAEQGQEEQPTSYVTVYNIKGDFSWATECYVQVWYTK